MDQRRRNGPVLVNASPAGTGDVLVMYTTGLGLTNPSIPDGIVSPSNPVAVNTRPVSVTVGGVPAQVCLQDSYLDLSLSTRST